MSDSPTPRRFYGGLTAEKVRNVISAQNRGASDDLIEDFLAEAQGRVRTAVGALPEWNDEWTAEEIPEPQGEIRGVIRDLAGARTMLKLLGSESDEGRRAGIALRDDALTRLQAFIDAAPGGSDSSEDGGYSSDYVDNFTERDVYAPDPYGPDPYSSYSTYGGRWHR